MVPLSSSHEMLPNDAGGESASESGRPMRRHDTDTDTDTDADPDTDTEVQARWRTK